MREDEFKALRDHFVRGSIDRVATIHSLLARLTQRSTDRDALRELHRSFHTLSGLGSTYGFPRISEVSRAAEGVCSEAVAGKTPVDEKLITRLRGFTNAMESAFRRGSTSEFRPFETVSSQSRELRRLIGLVVEDDPEMAELLRAMVEQEGVAVIDAASFADAIRRIDERLPNLLVVDIKLEGGSGYDVIRHLRELPGGDLVPALVVSALTGFLDRVEAIRAGADGYFEKPIEAEAFSRKVRHLLHENARESGRVLYVEDDADQARFVESVLSAAGYEMRICLDPRDFEKTMAAFKPDLLILDINLPEISGYDLARFVRMDETHAVLPILFLTTENNSSASIASVSSGGDDHLVKPVDPSVLIRSVAARIERARFLSELLDRDGLTGLLTHTRWVERVKVAYKDAARHPERSFVLAMIDVDKFKGINDQWGHPAADRVLAALGSYLRKRLRQSDSVGRYGGDEFGVVLSDLSGLEATRLLTEIQKEFGEFIHPVGSDESVCVTLSIGVAEFDSLTSISPAVWIEQADGALYEAKRAGRDRVVSASFEAE